MTAGNAFVIDVGAMVLLLYLTFSCHLYIYIFLSNFCAVNGQFVYVIAAEVYILCNVYYGL